MLSIPKYPEQYAQHFPAIFYLLCCASQHHVRGQGGGRRADHNAGGRDGRRAVETPEPKKKKKKAKQRTRVGKESRDGRGTARARERGKGRGKGGSPGDECGEAWTNTAANGGGGRGDKGPQGTLVRYPTSGVWPPPRCPYRPHLSAGNKVGYARDRWQAARGGSGLGGWPMGLTRSTPHGTYCGSCPVRGCG